VTSRERFLNILNGAVPDRVPVTLFIIDQGHFLNQFYPDLDPWDLETSQLKVIELQKQLGLDVFVRLLLADNEPLHFLFGGVDIHQQTQNWEVKKKESRHEQTLVKSYTITTPAGTLTQEMSFHELRKGTVMIACTKKPLKTPADLEIAMRYEPRMPKNWPMKVKNRIGRIRAALGDDGIIGIWSPHGPFNTVSLLIDHEELYSLFLTDYEYYEKLMSFAIERSVDYLRAIDAAGVDVHCIGGNVPGGFLGRKTYDRYILPFEKRYMDIVQERGTAGLYHNCGQIMALVESYKELGAKIVEPFSPHPLGDANLEDAKKMISGAYAMIGNIDQVNVLQKGSIDDVKTIVEKTIKTGKIGGRFILQSADFLEYGTPIENIEAYVKIAMNNASY
jgi:uroporphyrinogen decarboxylase